MDPESTPLPVGAVDLPVDAPIWDEVFTVAPLVVVGTMEDGTPDLAPKHMAMPLGWDNWFCFVCSPRHATHANALRTGEFTVSFPRPHHVIEISLAAGPRTDDGKASLAGVPTVPARAVDGVLLEHSYLWLECRLDRMIDGFGRNSLIIGRIVAAAVAEDSLRTSESDDADVIANAPLLAYVPPWRIAEISQTYSFPLHQGFSR